LIAFLAEGGQANRTLTVDFKKIKTVKAASDTVKGTLFQFKNRMIIKVTAPIEQFFLIDSGTTVIYNSNEHSAIRLNSKAPAVMPFFNTFVGFFKGAQVVPQVNFRIKSSEKRGDSLYTQWVPDGDQTSFRGKFETVYYNDKPVRASTFDKKGILLYRMTFGHDTLISGAHVPLLISTLTPAGPGPILEDVEFRNVSVNRPVPADIVNFKIPDGVPIKVIEW
jgi:outer membrane lipoprotein-sorting protein